MNADERLALAAAVEEAARAVPGVAVVYRSGSVLGEALARGIAAVAGAPAAAPAVRIDEEAGRRRVVLSIGVDAAAPAADTCRAVRDAVAHLADDAVVQITVAQIVE